MRCVCASISSSTCSMKRCLRVRLQTIWVSENLTDPQTMSLQVLFVLSWTSWTLLHFPGVNQSFTSLAYTTLHQTTCVRISYHTCKSQPVWNCQSTMKRRKEFNSLHCLNPRLVLLRVSRFQDAAHHSVSWVGETKNIRKINSQFRDQ
jgi:hypothetical protein